VLELESDMALLKSDMERSMADKDIIISEYKSRQIQLQNINNALKQEVRKLSRGNSPTSSSPTSPHSTPSISRASSGIVNEKALSRSRASSNSTMESPPDPEYLKVVILKFLESKDKRVR